MAEAIGGDFYNLLGVQRGATADEIQRAWRLRALTAHPDKKGGTEEWMKNLNKAKTVLLDPERRAKYDDEYEPETDINAVFMALNIGEKLSEHFKMRLQEWSNEFPNFIFTDNFDNGKIYNDAFQQIGRASQELLKIANDFQREEKLSFYETQYNKHLKQYEKEDLPTKLAAAFSNHWQLDEAKVSLTDKLWGWTHDRSDEGDSHFKAGLYLDALSWYIISAKTHILQSRAEELFRIKKYYEAKLYFIALYKKEPSTVTVAFMLTAASLNNVSEDKNLAEAIRTAAVVCDHPLLYSLMIKLLHQDKMYDEVIGAGKACERIYPNYRPQSDVLRIYSESTKYLENETLQVLRDWLYEFCANKNGFLKKISHRLVERGSTLLKQLYEELSTGRDITQLPVRYQASLLVFKGYYLEQEKDCKASLKAYQDAVILLPTGEVHSSVASLLNINHIQAMIASLAEQLNENDLPIPVAHQYGDRLTANANIRSAMKYEKAVHSGRRSNMTAALLYIDLCMSSFDTSMLCSNFVLASSFFLREMKQFEFVSEQRSNKQVSPLGTHRVPLSLMYALRNAIRDLCVMTAVKARTHEHPITELYFVKLSFILSKLSNDLFRAALTASGQLNLPNGNKPVLEEADTALAEMLSRSLTRLVKVTPFSDIRMTLSTDFLYVDAVGTEFLEVYYNRNAVDGPRSHKYQYELLELAWKCLPFSDGGKKFEQYRHAALISLLKQHPAWNINQIHSLMQWNVLNRDEEGFLDPSRPCLNLNGENFDSIDGVFIDLDEGSFHLIMTPTPRPAVFKKTDEMEHTGLFNMEDVLEVLQMGIGSSFFTLNQADFDMQSHPFQEMRFIPNNTYNSNFLATQLHADMLLKYLSTGIEISAKFPFAFRPTADKLVNALPEHLREFVLPTSERENGSKIGAAHRFWIECGELTYDVSHKEGDKLLYLFGKCPMKVKSHLLKYNAEGELIDDDDDDAESHVDSDGTESDEFDDETFSYNYEDDDDCDFDDNYEQDGSDFQSSTENDPEKEFADDMTRAYSSIGRYYRVLLRIRELYKLQAVYKILNQAYDNLEDAKKEVHVDIAPIQTLLSEIYDKAKECALSDEDINDVAAKLAEAFDVQKSENFVSLVSGCLRYGNTESVAQHVRIVRERRQVEKLSRFGNYCNKFGLKVNDLEKNREMNDPNGSECVWVPSAFCRNFPKRVYGGVSMNLKMKAHTVGGENGNPDAFKSSDVRTLNGHAGSRKIKSQINDRASTVANKSFGGKSSSNFRSKSGGDDDGRNRNKSNQNKSNQNKPGNVQTNSKVTTRGAGPCGKAKQHTHTFKSRKEAYDAAKNASNGLEPMCHWDKVSGWHYHPMRNKVHDVKSGKYFTDLRKQGISTHNNRKLVRGGKSTGGQTGGRHYCWNAPRPPGGIPGRKHKKKADENEENETSD